MKISTQLEQVLQGQQQLTSKFDTATALESKTEALGRFLEEYSLNLPFKSVTEFEQFDMILTSNPNVRNQFVSAIESLMCDLQWEKGPFCQFGITLSGQLSNVFYKF